MRLYARDSKIRRLAPAGIEFAPPRIEHSTGPGRHDFEIVVDPAAGVEDDLRRRDFTINAMARRLSDGELVDPFGGREDLARRVLRTVSPHGFEEDPLRIVRGLRFVSQLNLDPDEATRAQMHEHAASVALVSGERVGGGLAADGMGELSKLLLGSDSGKALRLARDTGVLAAIVPEFQATVGFELEGEGHSAPLDEHIIRVVEAAAAAGSTLRVRLAALFHDLGKPGCTEPQRHEERSARIAVAALRRLRYPNTLREWVVRIVRFHPVELDRTGAAEARRMLARYGDGLTFELLDHWHADLAGRDQSPGVAAKLTRLAGFRLVVEQELESPHRLADLAVDGSDLIEIGYQPGPALGRTLRELLDEVVESPALNERDTLLARAE